MCSGPNGFGGRDNVVSNDLVIVCLEGVPGLLTKGKVTKFIVCSGPYLALNFLENMLVEILRFTGTVFVFASLFLLVCFR